MYFRGAAQPHPLDADPPDADPLEADHPGNVTCDACWEANPPADRRNDRRL